MDSSSPTDRIRAWVEGQLPPPEAARLERELEADPELRAFAAAYREVHALTALTVVGADHTPRSATAFEDLAIDAGPVAAAPFPWRRVAAAAVLLLALGVAVLKHGGRRDDPRVRLTSISLAPLRLEPEARAASLPASLASYRSVDGGQVQWIPTLEEARDTARAADRPLVILWAYPQCPVARAVKEEVLGDETVAELAEQYVFVERDVTTVADEEWSAELTGEGYPYFEVLEDDRMIYLFSGHTDSAAFRDNLEQGLWERSEVTTPPSWELVGELARIDRRAREAEQSGRLGEARRAYQSLRASACCAAFRDAARAGLLRIAAEARAALLASRAAADDDAEQAEILLEAALARFADTPYAADLREVLESLRATGRFPELVATGAGVVDA